MKTRITCYGLVLIMPLCLIAEDLPADRPLNLIPVETVNKKQKLLRNLALWETKCGLITVENGEYMSMLTVPVAKDRELFNLIAGDPALPTKLQPGKYQFILDFKNNFVLREFITRSFTAAGSIKLYASKTLNIPSHKTWKPVGKEVVFGTQQPLNLSLGFVEARFLMIELNIIKEGTISSFSTMSAVSIARRGGASAVATSEAVVDNSKKERVPFNYARISEGAQIDFVSGGDTRRANSLLSEDSHDRYDFDTDSTQEAVVLDLGESHTLDGVSVVFDAPPSDFTFYFLDDLPEELKKKAQKTSDAFVLPLHPLALLAVDEGSLAELVSLGALRAEQATPGKMTDLISQLPESTKAVRQKVSGDEKNMHLKFPKTETPHRYVLVVWQKDPTAPNTGQGLTLYQLNVIGQEPLGDITADEVTPVFNFSNEEPQVPNNNPGPGDPPVFGDPTPPEVDNDNDPDPVPPSVPAVSL